MSKTYLMRPRTIMHGQAIGATHQGLREAAPGDLIIKAGSIREAYFLAIKYKAEEELKNLGVSTQHPSIPESTIATNPVPTQGEDEKSSPAATGEPQEGNQ